MRQKSSASTKSQTTTQASEADKTVTSPHMTHAMAAYPPWAHYPPHPHYPYYGPPFPLNPPRPTHQMDSLCHRGLILTCRHISRCLCTPILRGIRRQPNRDLTKIHLIRRTRTDKRRLHRAVPQHTRRGHRIPALRSPWLHLAATQLQHVSAAGANSSAAHGAVAARVWLATVPHGCANGHDED